MTKALEDFRAVFARMAAEAVINRIELASLLATTPGAVTQMAYRGELPPTAFPDKRRACWFVGDIRRWLAQAAKEREKATSSVCRESVPVRGGRPRLPTGAK
jgi:hypothetical protein